jgi:hypothetical protein
VVRRQQAMLLISRSAGVLANHRCGMKMGKTAVQGLLLLVCASVLLPGAVAQYRASIQGVVTDAQGSVVSGATVTLQNEETGQTLTATTNDEGVYNFGSLPPSHFTLAVEKTGFKRKVLKGVGVIAEQAEAVRGFVSVMISRYNFGTLERARILSVSV